MLKSIYTFAAAMIAAGIVALPNLSPQLQARGPALGGKGNRIDARPLGTFCSQRKWPYFEVPCLHDPQRPFGEARAVPLVPTDRLPPLPADAEPH